MLHLQDHPELCKADVMSSWKSLKFSKGLCDKFSDRSLYGSAALDSLGMSDGLLSVSKLP